MKAYSVTVISILVSSQGKNYLWNHNTASHYLSKASFLLLTTHLVTLNIQTILSLLQLSPSHFRSSKVSESGTAV